MGITTLIGLFVVMAAPITAFAATGEVRLALTPVGQQGSFFDLTMRPGEARTIKVDIANAGDAPLATRTYATDVYTIINGGFGGRLREAPQTGMTQWLDYPTEILDLPAGKSIRRSLTVTVPADAGPGEYITGLVLENDEPLRGSGAVALNQIVRQAVAVVVTVPGPRAPSLAIGAASHKVVAGKSIVSVAVENTGNVRLKPLVEFTLRDAAGAQVSQASVQMGTFYARTDTFVEVPLSALLLPGVYNVTLSVENATEGVRADSAAIAMVVAAPVGDTAGGGTVPGLTEVIQGGETPSAPILWGVVLLAGLVVGGIAIGLPLYRRRRRTTTRGS